MGEGFACVICDVLPVFGAEVLEVEGVEVTGGALQEHGEAIGADVMFDGIDHGAWVVAGDGAAVHHGDGMTGVDDGECAHFVEGVLDFEDAEGGIDGGGGSAIGIGPEHGDAFIGDESAVVGHVRVLERAGCAGQSGGEKVFQSLLCCGDDALFGGAVPGIVVEGFPVDGLIGWDLGAGPIWAVLWAADPHPIGAHACVGVCGCLDDVFDAEALCDLATDFWGGEDAGVDGDDGDGGVGIFEDEDPSEELVVGSEGFAEEVEGGVGFRGDLDFGGAREDLGVRGGVREEACGGGEEEQASDHGFSRARASRNLARASVFLPREARAWATPLTILMRQTGATSGSDSRGRSVSRAASPWASSVWC